MSAPQATRLHVETLAGDPDDDRPGFCLTHGFTQNSRCWAPFDRALSGFGPVRAVDLPGHGRSGPAVGDLWAAGRAVVRVAPAAVHVGYSLGGRVLLHGALADPAAVGRLVLIGAHPGIEDAAARAARRRADGERAATLERVGLDRFLDAWLALPLFAGLDDAAAHRPERLANDPRALAGALRTLGTGDQEPLWDRLADLDLPVLTLAGARDQRFCALGERMAAAIGATAEFVPVPGVGHAAHLEDPARTAAIIVDWLSRS